MGGTFKAIYRGHFDKSIPATDLATADKIDDVIGDDDANEGLTFDLDIAAQYSIWRNRFIGISGAFVIRNLLDLGFFHNANLISDTSQEAPDLQRRFDVGTKFQLKKIGPAYITINADVRHINHDFWTFKKGFHFGAELNLPFFSLLRVTGRVGINQGYSTFGLSFKALWFLLEYANYGEGIGTSDFSKENRVHMARLNLNF